MERPAIVGIGRTCFGEHYDKEPEKLIEESWLKASEMAGIERKDLDAAYLSDYFLQLTNKIGIEEGFVSELTELNIPMETSRSFSSALLNAYHAICCGKYDLVLVGGVEKMTDRWSKIRDDLMLLEDPWSYYAGCTPEANHELMLRSYIKRYNIAGNNLEKFNKALAYISVKNHRYGAKNEHAQFRREIDVDKVLNERAKVKPKPLGLYDFAPISDGAAAIIVASQKVAQSYNERVYIAACSSATDFITFSARRDRTSFVASALAMEKALKEANTKLSDIDIAEIYDQSTFLEMVPLEDLGFSEKGNAWFDVYNSFEQNKDFYEINGKRLFVNTNGGLKADGNPLGATGGAQIIEIFMQLNNAAGSRQVSNPQVGCTLELEGFGTKAYVNILRRE